MGAYDLPRMVGVRLRRILVGHPRWRRRCDPRAVPVEGAPAARDRPQGRSAHGCWSHGSPRWRGSQVSQCQAPVETDRASCRTCGRPAPNGRSCEQCRRYWKNNREVRQLRGECTRCGETMPDDVVGATCTDCRVRSRESARGRRLDRLSAGLCVSCGVATPSDGIKCDGCKEAAREATEARRPGVAESRDRARSAPMCVLCGNPRDESHSTRCQSCASDTRRAA